MQIQMVLNVLHYFIMSNYLKHTDKGRIINNGFSPDSFNTNYLIKRVSMNTTQRKKKGKNKQRNNNKISFKCHKN